MHVKSLTHKSGTITNRPDYCYNYFVEFFFFFFALVKVNAMESFSG